MSRAKAPEARTGNANGPAGPPAPAPENVLSPAPIPDPPDHLGPIGRRYWRDVWEAGAKVYRPETDAAVIDRYCSLQERRIKFLRVLESDGYTTVGSQGQTVAHPAAKLLSDVETKLTPLEDRLGLSPEARIRLGLAVTETKSRLDAFLEDE